MSGNKENIKHLDQELLFFYLLVALVSFIFYLINHPLLFFQYKDVNIKALLSAYTIDSLTYVIVFIPYNIIILILLIVKNVKKIKISDNVMIVLFFPLIGFFTKGMSLAEIYLDYNFIRIFKANIEFFSLLLIGPMIIIIHKIVVYIKNKKLHNE